MYQSLVIGDLARITSLDTRTNRTALPCGTDITEQCEAAVASGELVGRSQRDWLDGTLAESEVTWDVIAQQVMLGGFAIEETPEGTLVSTDTWDGYQSEREWLVNRLDAQPNPIVLSGDFHMAMVNEVRADPRNLGLSVTALELMAPSLTSDFFRFYTPDSVERFDAALPSNPQVQWSAHERGYLVTTLRPDHLTAEYRFVDDVTDPDSPVRSAETFTVQAGSRRVERAG